MQMLPTSSQRPCSLSAYSCRWNLWPTHSIHQKFWRINENCLCLQIQFLFPLHIDIASSWLWLSTRTQLRCSLESNLLDQIFFILTKCTHDKPLILWIVRILQCLSSWNTVRLQLFSGILHQYKIWLLGLVVRAFPLVLCIFAIDILYVQVHHSKVCLSWSHMARWTRLSSHNGSSRYFVTRFIFFTRFCDCTAKTEVINWNNCAKNSFNRLDSRRNSVSSIFQHLCSQALLWTMDS